MEKILKLSIASVIVSQSLMATVVIPEKCKNASRNTVMTVGGVIGGLVAGPVGVGAGAILFDNTNREECDSIIEKFEKEEKQKAASLESLRLQKIKIAREKARAKKQDKLVAALFEKNSDEIIAISNYTKDLNNIINEIKSIEIIGHTSDIGDKNYNYLLGLRRANALKKYLIENESIPREKIAVRSDAFNHILFTDEKMNQRAEIQVKHYKSIKLKPAKPISVKKDVQEENIPRKPIDSFITDFE